MRLERYPMKHSLDSRPSSVIDARPPDRSILPLVPCDTPLGAETQAQYIDNDFYYKRSYKGYVSA
jgi:hypothetical protein